MGVPHMTEEPAHMPLIKNGVLAEDPFQTVADDAPMPANGTIVSLARFPKIAKRCSPATRRSAYG